MTTEAKAAKDNTEGAKPEAQPKPKPEARVYTQEEVNRLVSKYQVQASEARKQLKPLERQLQELAAKVAKAEEEAQIARMGGDDEEGAAKARELLKRVRELEAKEKALDAREQTVHDYERKLTIQTLARQYGVEAHELDDMEDVKEMELYAREKRIAQLEAQAATVKANEPEPRSPGFDVGKPKPAGSGQPNWLELAKEPKKFDEAARKFVARR